MLEARAQSADDTAESRSPGTTRATGSTPAIDGIFCINDYAAFGVIRGLADYGIRVPDDVRVIGFDGATAGSYTTPTLSTVQVDLDQLAQFALDMITRRVEQRDQGDGRSDESAGMPATRATASTSPFGTVPSRRACMTSGEQSTRHTALAWRTVGFFAVTSTM